jgi:hypothetical protein
VEVGLETFFIRSTHLADEKLIFFGLPAMARCPELAAGQVNNAGSKNIREVFSSEPAVTNCSVFLYSLTCFLGYKLLP